jgi:autophagy-related protein 9
MFSNRSYRPIYADQELQQQAHSAASNSNSGRDVESGRQSPARQRLASTTIPAIEMTELGSSSSNSPPPFTVGKQRIAAERWLQTRNWDRLFQRIYHYYTGRGMFCIVLGRVFNLLTVAFVAAFATFLINCIDHQNISSRQSLSEALVPQCMAQLSGFHRLLLILCAAYWLWDFVDLVMSIQQLRDMRELYTTLLDIDDRQLEQFVDWNTIVERMIALHNRLLTLGLALSTTMPKRLNAHDIVNRIMRKENYFVALFNKDLLDLSLPIQLPGMGQCGRVMLTKVLEWTMFYCIGDYVFGEESAAEGQQLAVKQQFLRDDIQRSALVER